MIQEEIIKMIEQYDTIIIHHHISPDPDCLGSQLGLKYLIEASYPSKAVYAVGDTTIQKAFIGPMDIINAEVYQDALVIIVDVGDKARVDDKRFLNGKALIKIDHHPLTEPFADLEWVDTSFAAATEMIIELYMLNKNKLRMTDKAARVLYAGLLTDTGRFYYNSITERTLRYGAEVFQYKFDKQALYSELYYFSINELKLRGYIIENFESTKNGLGYMKITQEILEKFNITPEYASTLVNTLGNIKEIILWIFFIEYQDEGTIRVEFRSRGPIVNTLARKYGGGGHAWASGALVKEWTTTNSIINDANQMCIDFTSKT